jgi:hypothetical protein
MTPWDAFRSHMNQYHWYDSSPDSRVVQAALSRALNVIDGVLSNSTRVPQYAFREQSYLEKVKRTLWFSIAEKMLAKGLIPIELPAVIYYVDGYGFPGSVGAASNSTPFDSPEKVPASAEVVVVEMRVSCRYPWKIEEDQDGSPARL